jgi:2-enoate reductase
VIVGGGIQGCETAEFLVKRGRKVTIVEATDKVGMEIPMLQRILLLPWLAKKGATILTEVTYEEVTDKGLVVTDKEGRTVMLEADTVLVTIPLKPNPGVHDALREKAPEVHVIGDCREPGLIIDAIAGGFTVGRSV